MYFYLTLDKITDILSSIGLTIDISSFTDFQILMTFISFNIFYFIVLFLGLRIFYKLLYRLCRFVF